MDFLLSAALILMMFSMGLGLTLADFTGLLRSPKLVLTTLCGQLLILPALAVIIGVALNLSAPIAVGLLLVALCPSGSTSNFFCKLGQGNAALSVSLTAIISVVTVFSLPLVLLTLSPFLGYEGSALNLSFLDAIVDIGMHTLLPVTVGMGCRHGFTELSLKLEGPVVFLSSLMFGGVIVLLWWQNWEGITQAFALTGASTLLLLFLALTTGWLLGVVIKADLKDRFTMVLEVGIQNGALAFFIAMNLLQDVALVGPATVYTVAMVLVAVPLVFFRRRRL